MSGRSRPPSKSAASAKVEDGSCRPSLPSVEPSAMPAYLETPPSTGGLTLSAAGFPAPISATLVTEKVSTASSRGFGPTMPASLAYFDRDTSSWKTSKRSLFGDSTESQVTFPSSGLMLNGKCYRRAPSVPHTHGSDCSRWPTPRAADGLAHKIRSASSVQRMMTKQGRSKPSRLEDALALEGGEGGFANPQWLAWLMGFPLDWLTLPTEPSEIASAQSSPNTSAAV